MDKARLLELFDNAIFEAHRYMPMSPYTRRNLRTEFEKQLSEELKEEPKLET